MRNLKRLDNVWFWMVLAGIAMTFLMLTRANPFTYVANIIVYIIFSRLAVRKIYDSMFFRRIMPTWYRIAWVVLNLTLIPPATYYVLESWDSGDPLEIVFWGVSWVVIVAFSFMAFRERNTNLALKFIKKNAKS